MKKLKEMIEEFILKCYTVIKSEKGQGLVEYALLLVLIALVIISMLKGTGLEVNKVYSKINSALENQ